MWIVLTVKLICFTNCMGKLPHSICVILAHLGQRVQCTIDPEIAMFVDKYGFYSTRWDKILITSVQSDMGNCAPKPMQLNLLLTPCFNSCLPQGSHCACWCECQCKPVTHQPGPAYKVASNERFAIIRPKDSMRTSRHGSEWRNCPFFHC